MSPQGRTRPPSGLTVVLPAFNEENAIGQTLDALKKALDGVSRTAEILVVDDGSTDETAARASRTGVRVLKHPINSGYGRSLLTGIEAAQNDTIVIVDADGSYPIDQLPALLTFYDTGFDMAVGARKGRHYYSSPGKSLLRFVFRLLAEFTCGRKIPDINSGFRVFDRRPVLSHRSTISTGFSFTTTITLLFMLEHYFVGYVPVVYQPRVGKSKVRLWRDSLRSLQIIVTAIAQFNPLKLYVLVGLAYFAGAGLLLLTTFLQGAWFWPFCFYGLVFWSTLCLLMGGSILALAWLKPPPDQVVS